MRNNINMDNIKVLRLSRFGSISSPFRGEKLCRLLASFNSVRYHELFNLHWTFNDAQLADIRQRFGGSQGLCIRGGCRNIRTQLFSASVSTLRFLGWASSQVPPLAAISPNKFEMLEELSLNAPNLRQLSLPVS